MSYIIQSNDSFLLEQEKNTLQSNSAPNSPYSLHQILNTEIEKHWEVQETSSEIMFRFLYFSKNKKDSFLYTFEVNKLTFNCLIRINLMDRSGNYIKIANRHQQLYLLKQLQHLFQAKKIVLFSLSIDNKNKQIYLKFTNFSITSPIFNQIKEIKYLFHETEILMSSIATLITQSIHYNQEELSPPQLPKNKSESIRKIKSNLNKFGIFMHFPIGLEGQNESGSNVQKQQETKQRLLIDQIPFTKDQLKLISLFLPEDAFWEGKVHYFDLQFKFSQRQEITSKIQLPGIAKASSPYQNNAILNYIKLKNPNHVRLSPFSEGGFSKIYISQIDYWYVYSDSQNELITPHKNQKFSNQNMLHKWMVIKRDINSTQNSSGAYRINRIDHERNILLKIKHGNAIFLLKYYISEQESVIKSDLLVDFMQLPNLLQFIEHNKHTMSIFSKIYIIFMLIQGIRYLKSYEIVHLDLKPNNIMISNTYMPKIIDFGESFHKDVCKTEHHPGFTMPYSSPENYYPSNAFSQKNDIFSLGVIAYELFCSRFPFFLHNETTRSSAYKYKEYSNYWFYSPEEFHNYGESYVFPLIQLMIGRCLDPNPEFRPQIDWICLMMRECLDYYV